jgi:hypothetical protein
MIGEQPVGGLPDCRTMFSHNCLPVMYLQVTPRSVFSSASRAEPAAVANEPTIDHVSVII